MSFVPVTGTATFRAAQPPRDGVVEFTDERRTVALPIRAALPVLTKAHSRDDLHPSVGLLSGAALLGLRLVAAGQIEPAGSEPSWRMGPLAADDEDRVLRLAAARAHDGLAADEAEDVVRAVLDAVADAMPRAAPTAQRRPAVARPRRSSSGCANGSGATPSRAPELPQLVRISLRVEADEEELVAGAVRLVLQVHDEQNPLHLCDAAVLWTDDDREHGFGDRARTHAAIALRGAAEAWPVLDRLLELRVPDQITLDADELESLLEDGVAALAARGVDVLWPRSLGRDLTASDGARPVAADVRSARPSSAPASSARASSSASAGSSRCTATRSPRRRWTSWPAAPPRCCGCAATGPSSTRRSPARPASGWSARQRRPRRSRPP